jgi:hypothetical protein
MTQIIKKLGLYVVSWILNAIIWFFPQDEEADKTIGKYETME